jgi:hypothetical protein
MQPVCQLNFRGLYCNVQTEQALAETTTLKLQVSSLAMPTVWRFRHIVDTKPSELFESFLLPRIFCPALKVSGLKTLQTPKSLAFP